MKVGKLVLIIVSLVGLLFVGAYSLTKSDSEATQNLETTGSGKLSLSETSFDWGTIPISGGFAEKTFTLANSGSGSLTLGQVTTSCACTTAQLIKDGRSSPFFGMHTKSNFTMTLNPGEQADLKVIFDPAYHGPSGIGPIDRIISFVTNDPANRSVELNLKGLVVDEK